MSGERNYDAILEGRCPTCATPLERRDRTGWCPACNVGWSASRHGDEGEVRLTLEAKFTLTSLRPRP